LSSTTKPLITALKAEVADPPLFVRTLLLAEDTGFYGHRGIDLRELPAARSERIVMFASLSAQIDIRFASFVFDAGHLLAE
jgi:hypothetical protein